MLPAIVVDFDAPTLSAAAAWIAAVVAASVAGIQLFVGRRQTQASLISAQAALMSARNAGRHTVAEFRQKWIDKVIDTLCEHHSIIMTCETGQPLPSDDARRLSGARTRLEILLNPDEADTAELLKKIDEVAASRDAKDRDKRDAEMLVVARRLLKREWVRIKDELA